MRILLDTNILVHAYNDASPYQKKASKIMQKAVTGEIKACLTSQVLYEFFAVITNSKRVEHPIMAKEAANLCVDLWESPEIEKVNPTMLAPDEVFKLVKQLNLSRGRVFDCVLAITAKENKIETIFTENIDDFRIYNFLKCVNPLT